MADELVVGKLRAILGLDTAQYEAGARKASTVNAKLTAEMKQTRDEIRKFAAGSKEVTFKDMVAGMSAAGKQATASAKLIAGMSVAGKQAAASQLEAAQAAKVLEAATQRVQAPTAALSTRMLGLGVAVGTFLGAFAGQAIHSAISALANIAKQAVKTAGDLVDMSARTGISIEALQRMDHVAGQTGSTLEQFTKAAFQLGVRLNGGSNSVADAVKDLGLNLQALKAMRPEDQFATILDALGKIEDADSRNEIGLRLFGKTVAAVLPAAAEGYKKLAAEAKAAGDAQVLAIDKVADAWVALAKQIAVGSIQIGGSLALGIEALSKMTAMERMQAFVLAGSAHLLETLIKLGEARAKVLAEQANAQKAATDATRGAAKAEETYVQQLSTARAELAKLTPEQRRQIDSARALGVSLDDIENQLGLTPGLLKLYTDGTKAGEEATKKLNEELTKLSKEGAEEFQRAMEKSAKAIKEIEDQVFEFNQQRIEVIGEIVKDAAQLDSALDKLTQRDQDATLDRANKATLESVERISDARKNAAAEERGLEFEGAEFAIEQASRRGASFQQLYFMERDLSKRRLLAGIADANARFEAETTAIDRATTLGKLEYAALESEHRAVVERMTQDWQRGEETKRAALGLTRTLVAGQIVESAALTLQALSDLSEKSKTLAVAAKAGAIAAAIMNTYEGATKALAKLPPPFSFFAMGATIAAGLAQVAIIKKTPVGYREGTRDLDFQNFGSRTPTELHGQEAVIPRGSGHRLAGEIAVSLRNQFAWFARPGGQTALVHAGSRAGVTMSPGRIGGETHIHNHVTVQGWDGADILRVVETKVIPILNTASSRNTGGYATEHRKGFGIGAR